MQSNPSSTMLKKALPKIVYSFLASLLSIIMISGIPSLSFAVHDYKTTNTLSFLFGGENDFRNMDHAAYLTSSGELNNLLRFQDYYIELDNLFLIGKGDYYILNAYSTPSTYPSNVYKYVGRLTAGKVFPFQKSVLTLGAGVGYRYLHYKADFDALVGGGSITNVVNRYIEFFIPIEINVDTPLAGGYSLSFNNIIPIGPRGLMSHIFSGPTAFTAYSYHASIGISSAVLLNYKNVSIGPWASYDYLTTGFYNGSPTVTSGNQLKIVEFGLKASYRL